VLVAGFSLAGAAQAQLAAELHIGVTTQPAVMLATDHNVADARSDSRRALEWTSIRIGVAHADTASHANRWHAIRVGALVGGGLGLTGGVIADATQKGPTKIYGIAPLGGLIVGVLGGAAIGSVIDIVHSH
jgi:hypothetical protein